MTDVEDFKALLFKVRDTNTLPASPAPSPFSEVETGQAAFPSFLQHVFVQHLLCAGLKSSGFENTEYSGQVRHLEGTGDQEAHG